MLSQYFQKRAQKSPGEWRWLNSVLRLDRGSGPLTSLPVKILVGCKQDGSGMSVSCQWYVSIISARCHQYISIISVVCHQDVIMSVVCSGMSILWHQGVSSRSVVCHHNVSSMSARCQQYVRKGRFQKQDKCYSTFFVGNWKGYGQ